MRRASDVASPTRVDRAATPNVRRRAPAVSAASLASTARPRRRSARAGSIPRRARDLEPSTAASVPMGRTASPSRERRRTTRTPSFCSLPGRASVRARLSGSLPRTRTSACACERARPSSIVQPTTRAARPPSCRRGCSRTRRRRATRSARVIRIAWRPPRRWRLARRPICRSAFHTRTARARPESRADFR